MLKDRLSNITTFFGNLGKVGNDVDVSGRAEAGKQSLSSITDQSTTDAIKSGMLASLQPLTEMKVQVKSSTDNVNFAVINDSKVALTKKLLAYNDVDLVYSEPNTPFTVEVLDPNGVAASITASVEWLNGKIIINIS